MFDTLCVKGWSNYCAKFGYDLIVIKKQLDLSDRSRRRSPAWQKLLICSQEWSKNYDQIVWLDTDILINLKYSGDICNQTPIEKVSAVETYSIPNRHVHDIALKRLYLDWDKKRIKYIDNAQPHQYYKNRGIKAIFEINEVVQTGVFVCSPAYHREIFEHIYYSYEDRNGPEWNYEMPAMSYEIIKNNLQNWIRPEYNFCVSNLTSAYYPFFFHESGKYNIHKKLLRKAKSIILPGSSTLEKNQILALRNIFEMGYFIHFAGCASWMPVVHEQSIISEGVGCVGHGVG